jgi:hypothetical protein
MQIEEFLKHKENLEKKLTELVTKEVAIFKENTGYAPSDIEVSVFSTRTMGDPKPVFTVGQVSVTITF